MARVTHRLQEWVQQRYVLAVMLVLAVINIYSMRICLSMAIVEMVSTDAESSGGADGAVEDPDRCPEQVEVSPNSTLAQVAAQHEYDFHWLPGMEGQVLSSFYYGYILSHIPGGVLADKFGGKHTLGLGILSTALTTLLCVPCAYLGPGALMALRIITGLGEGVTFPAVSVLLAQWVPAEERSRLGSLVFSGAQLGTMFGTFFSGLLLHNYHWSSVFYFFGTIGVVWYVLWLVLCYSSPAQHPYISDTERKYLAERVSSRGAQKLAPTPWRGILTSVPVWGLAVAQVGHDWGLFTIATDLPRYMKSVLRFSIRANGLFSSLPYLVMWISALVCGAIADWLIAHGKMTILNVRKFFTSLAAVIPAIGIIGASYAGCDRVLVVVLFTLGMGSMGAFYPGMRVNGLDLSKNYAGTVMALVNGLGGVSGAVSPTLIGYLTPNNTLVEWRVMFWVTFAVLMASNAVYLMTAQAAKQPWDKQPDTEASPRGMEAGELKST